MPPASPLMCRFALPLAVVVALFTLALPASAQPLAGLVPSAGGASLVVTVDPATGATTTHGTIQARDENAPLGLYVDEEAGRAYGTRWGSAGTELLTVDLATGGVTVAPWPARHVWLVGYDASRARLLVLRVETDSLGGGVVRTSLRVVWRDPQTDAETPVATAVVADYAGEQHVAGDSLVATIARPLVAAGGRLVALAMAPDTTRLASVNLGSGQVTFGPAVAPWEQVIEVGDAVYRTGHTVTPAVTTGGPVTQTGRTLLVRDRLDGAAPPDTLAEVAVTRIENGHVAEWTTLTRWGNVAAHDRANDRLVMAVDGRFRLVDLATGAVTSGAPVPEGLRLAVVTDAASPVATDAPAETPALRLSASPNPASGAVRIAVGDADAVRVEAFSALGRRVALVHDGPLPAGEVAWDTTALPAGVYVVRATTEMASATLRLTVAR